MTAETEATAIEVADHAVVQMTRLVEAWEHLRLDTVEDQQLHQRLIQTSRDVLDQYRGLRAAGYRCGTCHEPIQRQWRHVDEGYHNHNVVPTLTPRPPTVDD